MNPEAGIWWLEGGQPAATGQARDGGLSRAEADAQRARFGPNQIQAGPRQAILRQYLARFKNPLVIILLFASAVAAFTGEITDFIIIACIVLLSVTLDFVQEYRANRAAERLRQSVSLRARVVRDGGMCEIPAREVVPGDIVLLSAGDLIPADARVCEASDFFVNQSLLTGEAYPVEKRPGIPTAGGADLQSASNAVFMGTSVISGSARVEAVKTGAHTELGAISESLNQPAQPTAFELGTRRFGMLIMRLTFLMVLFVVLVNAFSHRPWLESFLFALALAVGLTPELLPMVVSVTLSRGALRMARKKTIVKRLSAIHDLGAMDVLCTDKTGTLTEAHIRLERHVDALGRPSDRVLEMAYLNSFFETGLKSPLDDAILAHRHIPVEAWKKIDEVPFDFERRRVSVLIDKGSERWLVVKGAADEIVNLCTQYEEGADGASQPIGAEILEAIRARYQDLEQEGFRVLGIAVRRVSSGHVHAVVGDESELVLVGFAAFLDPPKTSAAPALAALSRAGVTIKIITGDSVRVTRHVCAQLGIEVTGVLTGAEISSLDNAALQSRVESFNLFCRMNPAQKERIILALKARNHVVGYLGDGINDAPSLHAADVGLSVDSAVDVAREAADMILLQHDLHVLHAGVMEGRRTFGNIMKYILMATSSNFGNMFSMAAASVFLPFLPMLPSQILLNNILYDVSEIPIPMDRVDADEVRSPRTLDMRFIRNFMFSIGPISSLFDLLTFYVMLAVLQAGEALFRTGWFVESLCTQVLVIFVIRTRYHPLASRPNRLLVTTSLAVATAAVFLPLTAVGAYFGFVPLPPVFYLILGGMVAAYLVMVEVVKQRFYRRVLPNLPRIG